MKGYIYLLADPSGKKYVGQTVDFKRRMRQYQQPSRANDSEIYRAVARIGFENFEKTILKTVEGSQEYVSEKLNELEKEYIQTLNTVKNGYNTQVSDAHKVRRIKFSVKTREKMSRSQTGRIHSEESKRKRSGANAYQSKKVFSKTLGMTFDTLKDAAEYSGTSGGCKISECISGKRKSAGRDPKTGEKINDWEYL